MGMILSEGPGLRPVAQERAQAAFEKPKPAVRGGLGEAVYIKKKSKFKVPEKAFCARFTRTCCY